jgi:hypothetical protein
MALKFLKLKSKVKLLLKAKTSISIISTTLNKSKKSIYNTIQRIKNKEKDNSIIKRVKLGRISKITLRDKRVINRDLIRSPKKENKKLLLENSLPIKKRAL